MTSDDEDRDLLPADPSGRVPLSERAKRPGWWIIAALIAAGAISAVVLTGGGSTSPTGGSVNVTATTALIQLRGSGGAVGSLLLAHDDASQQGLELVIPSRLEADACGVGAQQFGKLLALPNGVTLSQRALSTTLDGARIDGSWVLAPKQLADLVRRLGGSQSGAATGVLSAVRNILAVLPRSESEIADAIRASGGFVSPGLGVPRLASLLRGAADDANRGTLLPSDLPVTVIRTGGGRPSYSPNASAISHLVRNRLVGALPAGQRAVTVLLLNGVGRPGLVPAACPKLASHGLLYAGGGNAATFGHRHSVVEVAPKDAAAGRQVAAALGLPARDVRRATANQNIATVVVILGRDFKP